MQRIISLPSRGTVELSLKDLIIDGALMINPIIEKMGLVFLSLNKGRITLSAGAYIGLIPLNRFLSIDVQPRLPIGNLAHILDVAQGTLGSLRGTERRYLLADQPNKSVLSFIALNLVDAIQAIEVKGFAKEYVREQSLTSHPRGRILIGETRAHCVARGNFTKVVTETFKQTSNTAINRVLKNALFVAAKSLAPLDSSNIQLKASLSHCLRAVPGEVGKLSRLEHENVNARKITAESISLHRRAEYARALDIAMMILGAENVVLNLEGQDRTLSSFILNLESIVEVYFRNSLRNRACQNLTFGDGNDESKRPLFSDRPKGAQAQPDIVVMHSAKAVPVVAEIKYKLKVDRADINQAITYSVVYGTQEVVIIHIASTSRPSGAYLLGQVGNVTVHGYAFDLACIQLENEEQKLYDFLRMLIKPMEAEYQDDNIPVSLVVPA